MTTIDLAKLPAKIRKELVAFTRLSERVRDKRPGYRRICQRVPVYVVKQYGLVIKQPNFIMSPPPPHPEVLIPTVKLRDGWVVQPVANRAKKRMAALMIRKIIGEYFTDLHPDNVGWVKGKPVMFDW